MISSSKTNAKKAAVKSVSIDVKQGEIIGIIGPNGAGKSSLINILSMIIPRSHGQILILDQDIQTLDTSKQVNKFGIVSQNDIIWEVLTVNEHFNYIG